MFLAGLIFLRPFARAFRAHVPPPLGDGRFEVGRSLSHVLLFLFFFFFLFSPLGVNEENTRGERWPHGTPANPPKFKQIERGGEGGRSRGFGEEGGGNPGGPGSFLFRSCFLPPPSLFGQQRAVCCDVSPGSFAPI